MRWIIFFLVSLPFIVPFRWYPDGDFFSDSIAIFIALIFVVFSKGLRLTSPVLVGFALALAILVAGLLGGSEYMDAWFAPALMVFVGAVFLGCLQARQPANAEVDRNALVYGLVAGGGVSILLALGQIFEWRGIDVLIFNGASGVVANIGQRNQFSLYVLVAFFAFLVVLARSPMVMWRSFGALLLSSFLCSFVLAHAGSRAVVLMVFSAIFIAFARLFWWRSDRLSYYVLIFSVIFFSVQFLSVFSPGFLLVDESGSGVARLQSVYADSRWGEWGKAWGIFLEHPAGVGFGNYAYYSFSAGYEGVVWANPHNLLLYFLVELGVLGFALVFFGLLLVMFGSACYLRSSRGDVFLPCAVLFLILHNLLEYSFWYANFFLLFLTLLAYIPYSGLYARIRSVRLGSVLLLFLLSVVVVQYGQLLGAVWLAGAKNQVARVVVSARVGLNPFLSWRADKVLMDYLPYDDGPDLGWRFCRLEAMVTREPLPQNLERMAFLAMVMNDYGLAGGILKTRYKVLSDPTSYYFESAVRRAWPLAADNVIGSFKENKLDGFKAYAEYQLGGSGKCD